MRRPFAVTLILAALCSAMAVAPAAGAAVEVGQEAPPITLKGDDGSTYSSEALEGDKPLVAIFFRGPW